MIDIDHLFIFYQVNAFIAYLIALSFWCVCSNALFEPNERKDKIKVFFKIYIPGCIMITVIAYSLYAGGALVFDKYR